MYPTPRNSGKRARKKKRPKTFLEHLAAEGTDPGAEGNIHRFKNKKRKKPIAVGPWLLIIINNKICREKTARSFCFACFFFFFIFLTGLINQAVFSSPLFFFFLFLTFSLFCFLRILYSLRGRSYRQDLLRFCFGKHHIILHLVASCRLGRKPLGLAYKHAQKLGFFSFGQVRTGQVQSLSNLTLCALY